MKRSFSSREIVLIAILVIIALFAGYYLLWYNPVNSHITELQNKAASLEDQLATQEAMAQDLQYMQSALPELKKGGESSSVIAPYDNQKPLMKELNRILESTEDYSLTFGKVDTKADPIERPVALEFVCGSYKEARQVLRDLRDNPNRCMIEDLKITLKDRANITEGGGGSGKVTVNATLIFFEMK